MVQQGWAGVGVRVGANKGLYGVQDYGVVQEYDFYGSVFLSDFINGI